MHPLKNEDLHYIDIIKLQYERIAHHENQRLTFSSLVMTITTTLLTILFAVENKLTPVIVCFLCFLMILINYIAINFVLKSRYWVKVHQNRARYILNKYNPELAKSIYNDEGVRQQPDLGIPNPPLKMDSNKDPFRRPNLQVWLHIFLILAMFIFIIIKYELYSYIL